MKAVDQLEALENFAVFAEAESLRAAARTLGMVPSTLLRRMRALEKDFGRRLFAASPRGIALTPEGMALHAKVARILAGMNAEAPGDAAGISGSGPIRIAADPVLSVGTILSAVGALCEERNLRIEVVRPGRLSRPDILLKILRGNSLPGSRGQFALVPLPRRILAASPASIERRGLTIAPEYLERQHILRIDGDEAPIEQMGPAGEEAQLLRELPPPGISSSRCRSPAGEHPDGRRARCGTLKARRRKSALLRPTHSGSARMGVPGGTSGARTLFRTGGRPGARRRARALLRRQGRSVRIMSRISRLFSPLHAWQLKQPPCRRST